MPDWSAISRQLEATLGTSLGTGQPQAVGGGCINQAYVLRFARQAYFVKLNSRNRLAMFEAEAEGLQEILAGQCILVPEPLVCGIADQQAFLVMRYLPLQGHGSAARLGEQLAAMHAIRHHRFGWRRDNTIGATPQINTPGADWVTFWRRQRLAYQLALARENGAGDALWQRGERLLEGLDALFEGYRPVPSLLHGDLWSGNVAYSTAGEPVIFDPAVYYGDRETDIAMTELFGGFPAEFYAAYQSAWPLDAGYRTRRQLYNLYHVLNHFNLFGGGYASQAAGLIDRLLAELG